MDIKDIAAEWAKHEETPFPLGHRTKPVGNSNLTMLESETASNIMTFIQTEGRLVGRRKAELQNQIETLVEAVEDLNGEAKLYFEGLKEISEKVLDLATE